MWPNSLDWVEMNVPKHRASIGLRVHQHRLIAPSKQWPIRPMCSMNPSGTSLRYRMTCPRFLRAGADTDESDGPSKIGEVLHLPKGYGSRPAPGEMFHNQWEYRGSPSEADHGSSHDRPYSDIQYAEAKASEQRIACARNSQQKACPRYQPEIFEDKGLVRLEHRKHDMNYRRRYHTDSWVGWLVV